MSGEQGDAQARIQAEVIASHSAAKPIFIEGGRSKRFLTPEDGSANGDSTLSTTAHRGIVTHEPSELVLTARAGTLISEVEQVLGDAGQMFAFEPPHFDNGATIGGMVSCGLSGPRRPYTGAVRDFVLGTQLINGRGDVMRFGGEVMKNVAGYDVSRLVTGAFGTLGVLLEASFKVLPSPQTERTVVRNIDRASAIEEMNRLATMPLPLSATAHENGQLRVRLSGSHFGVDAGVRELAQAGYADIEGSGSQADQNNYWGNLKNHDRAFFETDKRLWRLSVPPTTSDVALADPKLAASDDDWIVEWGGAQRWLRCDAPAADLRRLASQCGGHATLFRGTLNPGEERFQPLQPAVFKLHQRIKQAMDPNRILNPGRIYYDL